MQRVVQEAAGSRARQCDPPSLSPAERASQASGSGPARRTSHLADPPFLTPAERADLASHVEAGRLVVQTPEETEDWERRRWLEALMSEAIDDIRVNQPTAALNEALAAAQGAFPAIPRDKQVTVQTATGGTYTFRYAPLDTILAAVRPALAEQNLAITQLLADNGAGLSLITELRHSDGALIRSSLKLPPNRKLLKDGREVDGGPQGLGSLLTYMRRYAIVAMLGIAAEEDDDGNHAQDAAQRSGADVPGKPTAPPMITDAQHKKIGVQVRELTEKWPTDGLTSWADNLRMQFHVRSRKELTQVQASEAIDWLQQHLDAIPELKDV